MYGCVCMGVYICMCVCVFERVLVFGEFVRMKCLRDLGFLGYLMFYM